MDELVKMVVSKTGIGEDQARTAVNTVIGFLKDRLPGPVAGQLDGILGGGQGQAQGGKQGSQGLGGMLKNNPLDQG